jgi:PKD repeat protein
MLYTMRYFLLIAALFCLSSLAFAQNGAAQFVDGKIYFKVKSSKHPKTNTIFFPGKNNGKDLPVDIENPQQYGITKVDYAFGASKSAELNKIYAVEFTNHRAADALIAALQKSPNIEFAEKVPLDKKVLSPNDPRFPEQWHLSKINATTAWDYFSTGSTVPVAIIDDAVDRTHPDLAPNIWVNPGEIPGNGIDDDGNGYIDDINGWDVALNTNDPNPPNNLYDHGTHVAGIAGAATNNGVGIASIGFSVKIMAVKATNDPNSITHGYAGLRYAVDAGAKIVNLSWGSSFFSNANQAAINYAISQGVIVVAAAGNENSSSMYYPAAYNGVVSVASTNQNDEKSDFSNYGSWIKISAPGSSILSTYPFNRYGFSSGTSMASPMVAGLLGLMKSFNPGLPNANLINCVYNTADDINQANPAFPGQLGAGRINAQKAMECILGSFSNPPIADFTANTTSIQAGGNVRFTDLSSFLPTSWEWSFPGGTPATSNLQQPPNVVYSNPGTYSVTLKVTNANGTDTRTRTNYINVAAPSSCVRPNLPIPSGWTIVNYLAGASADQAGHVNGVNRFDDRQKAMLFDLFFGTTPQHRLTGCRVLFGTAFSANPSKWVYLRIFDGSAAQPGAEIARDSITIGEIMEDVEDQVFTVFSFRNNIALPGSRRIFASVDFSSLSFAVGDRLSILSNTEGQSNSTDIYEMASDGSWLRYGDNGSWDLLNASLLIHPDITGSPITPRITPSTATVCSGNQVELSTSGSTLISGLPYQWALQGTAPSIISNQAVINPTYNTAGSFKAYLLALGACSEIRIDSAAITVNQTPPLAITASTNPICQGESTLLTASGGSSYTWSPSTGLSATTGSSVTANPTVSTSYTISTSNGLCSNSIIYEVVVRGRTAGVGLSSNPATINAPTSVTFTATPVNGGGAPVYNFLVNNISRQSGASAVFTAQVAPGDRVICQMTSTEPCVTDKTVSSNELVMGGTLPVRLVQFVGKRSTEGNLLQWTTAAEWNTSHFEVEYSLEGSRFAKAGQVAAAGHSSVPLSYRYVHSPSVKERVWYRLRMVDIDGSFTYSPIIMLEPENGRLITRLYPNPTQRGQRALLQLPASSPETVLVQVSNAAGQQMEAYRVSAVNGTLNIVLASDRLTPGMYLITCRNAKGEVIESVKWTVLP